MNPNANTATTQAMLRIAHEVLPGLTGWTAPDGPEMIVDETALAESASLVSQARLPMAHGVIVSAFGDPGRDLLAARMQCPGIGIGAAAARAAGRHARNFAVTTTTPGLENAIDALMNKEQPDNSRYLGCFFAKGDTQQLMANETRLDAALLTAINRAADAGAEAVIIGGGPLGEAADRLVDHAPVPLIAPIRVASAELVAALNAADAK
jgi:Asp/Glu/hydantoin racemase